jgi:hypothetical protein
MLKLHYAALDVSQSRTAMCVIDARANIVLEMATQSTAEAIVAPLLPRPP